MFELLTKFRKCNIFFSIAIVLSIILFIKFRPEKSKIIGKWERYAQSNAKGDLEALNKDERFIFKFLKDGRLIIKSLHDGQLKAKIVVYEISGNKLFIKNGGYSYSFRIKEINNRIMVLYDLSRPISEHYFKKIKNNKHSLKFKTLLT